MGSPEIQEFAAQPSDLLYMKKKKKPLGYTKEASETSPPRQIGKNDRTAYICMQNGECQELDAAEPSFVREGKRDRSL